MKRFFQILALCLTAALLIGPAGAAEPTRFFAAGSLTDVSGSIAKLYTETTGKAVDLNLASSSTLAKQIDMGAPADIFISANPKWMNWLDEKGRIVPDSKRIILGNRLALIVPKNSRLEIKDVNDLAGAEVTRIALGDPSHVPAGIYARQALESLGLWDKLQEKLLAAKDVRTALAYVERGEAEAGLVYQTDAKSSSRVRLVLLLPEKSHKLIRYPMAVVKGSAKGADLYRFILDDPRCAKIFEAAGFVWLGEGEK